ncbi:MAG: lipoyl synthase [Zetaproteobacteria bacterium]|nr:MAG: lipoyl synthase [Zetaproteobacteria bacterium]
MSRPVIPIAEEREGPFHPKPRWLKVRAPLSREYRDLHRLMRALRLNTVCEEASCPNIGDCWHAGSATFMILGRVCTRRCSFCDVATGRPDPVDPDEAERLADAVERTGLRHVVITSVDRDDLPDGGAGHYALVIRTLRARRPDAVIEVLTPDFRRKPDDALARVIAAGPDIFNHNLETVPRLYRKVRPGARYFTSLRLLQRARELDGRVVTKSGIMVGLGESRDEVLQVLDDLRAAGVEMVTIGQYLRPGPEHHPVERYWEPAEFDDLKREAERRGFAMVASGPLVRSSFHAGEFFRRMQEERRRGGAAQGASSTQPPPLPLAT